MGYSPAIRPYAINPNDPFNPGDRGSILDIYGSGFGTSTSTVRFYENTNSPPVIADAEDILFWSDTQIKCRLPGRQDFRHASSNLVYVITGGGTSNGFQYGVSFASASKRFLNLPITYYINENGTPDCDGEFAAVQNGFQSWEDVIGSNLDYTYGGTTALTHNPSDGVNVCSWIESGWLFDQYAVAVNEYRYNSDPDSPQLVESDIAFNGQGYVWTTTGQANRYDVQNTATHEIGHDLVLLDLYGSSDIEKTMYGIGVVVETKKRTVEQEDIDGVRYIHPDSYSLTLQNVFEFDPTSGGQMNVSNVSQGTNSIAYALPQNRTVFFGNTFEFSAYPQYTLNGKDYRFSGWTYNGNSPTIVAGFTYQPLPFIANYKGHLLSTQSTATSANGQRKLARDANGNYHLVYESNGSIWYSVSTDNGQTWSTEENVYAGGPQYPRAYPMIATHLNYIFVVWQEYEGVVTGLHQYRINGVWKQLGGWWAQINSYSPSQPLLARFSTPTDALPTLVAADNTFNEHSQGFPVRPELMCVWRSGDGIYSGVGNWDVIAGSGQVYMWNPFVRFGRIAGTTSSSFRPALGADFLSRVGVAYQENNMVYAMLNDGGGWSASELVSTPVFEIETNLTPSIAVDNLSRLVVAWEYFDGETIGSRVKIRRRETNGSWGVATLFSGVQVSPYVDGLLNRVPSVSGYAQYNSDYAVTWQTSQNTVQLKKNTGGVWGPSQIVGNPGFDPNLSVNESASLDAKITYRSNNSSPYALAFTSQYLPNSPLEFSDDIFREIRVSGDSFAVSLRIGDLLLRNSASMEPIEFATFPDTTVVYGTDDVRRVFASESFTVGTNSFLDLTGRVRVLNGSWIRSNWRNTTSVVLTLEAVDSSTGHILGRPLQYSISRNRIPSVSGSVSVPLSALAGTTVYLRARVSLTNDLSARLHATDERIPQSVSLRPVAKVGGSDEAHMPTLYTLEQNFPNPFNPTTNIGFQIPKDELVSLKVYDMLGQEVATLVNERRTAGSYDVAFNGASLGSGMYIYRLTAGQFTASKKLVLIK